MKNELGDCTSRWYLHFCFSSSGGGWSRSISLDSTCAPPAARHAPPSHTIPAAPHHTIKVPGTAPQGRGCRPAAVTPSLPTMLPPPPPPARPSHHGGGGAGGGGARRRGAAGAGLRGVPAAQARDAVADKAAGRRPDRPPGYLLLLLLLLLPLSDRHFTSPCHRGLDATSTPGGPVLRLLAPAEQFLPPPLLGTAARAEPGGATAAQGRLHPGRQCLRKVTVCITATAPRTCAAGRGSRRGSLRSLTARWMGSQCTSRTYPCILCVGPLGTPDAPTQW